MKARIIASCVVGTIAAIVTISARSSNRTKLERNAKYASHEMVSSCDAYQTERDYVEAIYGAAHAEAFDDNFIVAGRYSTGRLDLPSYEEEVFALMIERAHGDRHDKVADSLARTWIKSHPRSRGTP